MIFTINLTMPKMPRTLRPRSRPIKVGLCLMLTFMVLLAFPAYQANATGITRVQGPVRASTVSGISFTVTQVSVPTNGDLNVLTFGSTSVLVNSITQTNVQWILADSDNSVLTQAHVEIWIGIVGVGASSTLTVHLSNSISSTIAIANVCEYSGLATTSIVDQVASASSNGNSASTGTTSTTSQANELWVASISNNMAAQSNPTNGFTLLDGTFESYMSSAYLEKIVSGTGSAASGTTIGSSFGGSAGVIVTLAASPVRTIYRIQSTRASTTTGSTLSFNQTYAPTNGDVDVLTYGSSFVEVNSITQTNVHWVLVNSNNGAGSATHAEIWVGIIGIGASNLITVNLSGTVSSSIVVANICEYSGLATTSIIDQFASTSGAGTSTTNTGTTSTTTQANELWVGTIEDNTAANGDPTNGFAMMDGQFLSYMSSAYLEKIVTTTGQASSSPTRQSSSGGWTGVIVTFASSPVRTTNPILRVQSTRASVISGNSISLTQTYTPTSGDLNVLTFGSPPVTISSITQTGVAWNLQVSGNGGNQFAQIWVGVISAGASASMSITLSGSFTNSVATVNVCEYSGLVTSGFVDQTASTTGSGTPSSTGTTSTTTQGKELWIGSITHNIASSANPTNGFSMMDGTYLGGYLSSAYLEKIVTTTGQASSSTTTFSSGQWAGVMLTLEGVLTTYTTTFDTTSTTTTRSSSTTTKTYDTKTLTSTSTISSTSVTPGGPVTTSTIISASTTTTTNGTTTITSTASTTETTSSTSSSTTLTATIITGTSTVTETSSGTVTSTSTSGTMTALLNATVLTTTTSSTTTLSFSTATATKSTSGTSTFTGTTTLTSGTTTIVLANSTVTSGSTTIISTTTSTFGTSTLTTTFISTSGTTTFTSFSITTYDTTITVLVAAPRIPSSLAVVTDPGNPSSALDLTWVDTASDWTSFRIERSGDSIVWIQIAETTNHFYADSGLASGTNYFYRVHAFRSSDGTFSDYSNTAAGSTLGSPPVGTGPGGGGGGGTATQFHIYVQVNDGVTGTAIANAVVQIGLTQKQTDSSGLVNMGLFNINQQYSITITANNYQSSTFSTPTLTGDYTARVKLSPTTTSTPLNPFGDLGALLGSLTSQQWLGIALVGIAMGAVALIARRVQEQQAKKRRKKSP